MVNAIVRRVGLALLMLGVLLAAAPSATAAVRAVADRLTVDLNESFMLEVVVDSNVDLEPDLSVLDADFYRGQVSQLSNTSIFNGEIRRSRTWTIALMPKRTGLLTIPPIVIGTEQSEPLNINVREPADEPPGEADVFITSEVDRSQSHVQAQILYRIKIYRAVATRQPALREPTISGAEVLVEIAGDEKTYDAVLNGKAYNVVERVIAIYPQESGDVEISPARFEARVLQGGRITGRKVFQSQPHTIKVLPVPPPPADYPNAAWLPAKDVRLREEWSREPDRINAGEPVTRRVTVDALGQIETQIPAVELPEVDGINVYADKPELTRRVEAAGIRGIREDQYAMIGVRGGDTELPGLAVPWWNTESLEWEVAMLPARTIRINAPLQPVTNAPVVDQPIAAASAETPTASQLPATFWQRVSQLLAGVWALTILAWWWSARDGRRAPRQPAPPPVYKQQAKFLKAARRAALSGNAADVRSALLCWARLQWPDDAPRSVGELAKRVSSPLADELGALSAASYAPGGREFDGDKLAKALRSFAVLDAGKSEPLEEPLPPLMPPLN
ncbi:MAG: BatD family protein [Gammaproteobacteria bacterium]|nr:BatD family protein [Gammaproteobacteria bacterium]